MKTRSILLICSLCWGALPQALHACSMCMGAQDAPTASAVNNAIYIMFGVLGLIFTGICSVFFGFYRRAKRASQEEQEFATLAREVKEASQHA